MKKPVREDMAAFGIGAELDLIHHQTGDGNFQRHGLDGADIEARRLGHNLFLAGDQGDFVCAPQPHDAVIDFARQQAQRQADHARFVRQHALNGEEGLARVGGAQDRTDFGMWRAAGGSLRHGRQYGVRR